MLEIRSISSELLSPLEATDYLANSVAVQTLSNWRCTKNPDGPPWIKIGRKIRYRKKDLDLFLERSLRNPRV